MILVKKTILLIASILFFSFFQPIFLQPAFSADLDLNSAQNRVGKRFAVKFCEAKKDGLNGESSCEFALNNTFLKFVEFPDDEKYIDDLWTFTKQQIYENCGDLLTKKDVIDLHEFFAEEAEIASNRDLYLPKMEYVITPKN